jgi:hypothetical protein
MVARRTNRGDRRSVAAHLGPRFGRAAGGGRGSAAEASPLSGRRECALVHRDGASRPAGLTTTPRSNDRAVPFSCLHWRVVAAQRPSSAAGGQPNMRIALDDEKM